MAFLVQKETLHSNLEPVAHLRERLPDEKVNYQLIREELALIAGENTRQTQELIKNYLEKAHEAQSQKKLTEALHREMSSWKGNLWKLTRRYEEWLQETLAEELDSISLTDREHSWEP